MAPLIARTVVLLVQRRLHAFCQMVMVPDNGLATLHAAAVRALCALKLGRQLAPAGAFCYQAAICVIAAIFESLSHGTKVRRWPGGPK